MSCVKAVTFLAENTGTIAALTQQEILSGDPEWFLNQIKDVTYNTELGHQPRYVRVRTTPPRNSRYQPMLPEGNKSYNIANPQTGEITAVDGDKTGRGCSLPADKINYGYDEKQRCLQGKAWEAGPWCVLDLLEKKAFRPLLEKLWADIPRYGKEAFGRQLARDVFTYSMWKFSIAAGFPQTTNTATLPTPPTGGPSIGFFRHVERLLMAQGYAKNSGNPMVNGRPMIKIRMGREAIEWAIQQRKKELGLTIDSRLYVDDGIWGKTVVYEGIQFIEADLPTRGYMRQTGASSWEFVELDPIVIRAADGEGFWPDPNPDYYDQQIRVGGVDYRVIELAHIVHPSAMVRESLGAIPAVKGKSFSRAFDFEVNTIPDWELADKGCNKDEFWFGYRMRHAYAPRPVNPELMTVIAYLNPGNFWEVVDPYTPIGTADSEPVTQAPLPDPAVNTCLPCSGDSQVVTGDPTSPTCADQEPTNGVGVMTFQSVAYAVEEGAGNLTIVVQRTGGSSGAASAVLTLTEGTAVEPGNFGIPSGFAGTTGVSTSFTKTISWTDGEYGPKTVVIPIVEAAGDDEGKQFTGALGTAVGATIGTASSTTITILDEDNA